MCGLLLVFSAFAVVSLPVRSFRLDVRAAARRHPRLVPKIQDLQHLPIPPRDRAATSPTDAQDRRTRFPARYYRASPDIFASRATPRVKITRRRGRIIIARASHRASVRPDPAPRRASARANARRNISRARASRSRARVSVTRARIARAPAVCRSTTRRKVKCARRPAGSRIFAIDAPARASTLTASSARDHRSTRLGSTMAIGDRSTARRRDRVTSARDRGGSGKTCNTRRAIASGVGD